MYLDGTRSGVCFRPGRNTEDVKDLEQCRGKLDAFIVSKCNRNVSEKGNLKQSRLGQTASRWRVRLRPLASRGVTGIYEENRADLASRWRKACGRPFTTAEPLRGSSSRFEDDERAGIARLVDEDV